MFDIWDNPVPYRFNVFSEFPGNAFSDSENFIATCAGHEAEVWNHPARLSDEAGDQNPFRMPRYSTLTEGEGGEIVVVGRVQSDPVPPSGGGGRYVPRHPDDGGAGGDEGATNTDFSVTNDDAICQDGAAVNAAAAISSLVNTVGNFEFSGLLVQNSNGTFGLSQNELSTRYSTDSSSFDGLSSYSSSYGIVHNHAFDDSNYNANFLNRYPSSGDWAALDLLVAGGANPNNLSVFILDPFGDLREFSYTDKALYESMTDSQRYADENLPSETQGCS